MTRIQQVTAVVFHGIYWTPTSMFQRLAMHLDDEINSVLMEFRGSMWSTERVFAYARTLGRD